MERRDTLRAWLRDVGYLYAIVTALIVGSLLVGVIWRWAALPPVGALQTQWVGGPPGYLR